MEASNQTETQKKANFNIKQFLSGNILVQESIRKHLWYILFVVLLSVIYINNKYKTESILVDIIRLQGEVKELRDRSVSYASELMSISRESEVLKIIERKNVDLKELKLPPQKIVVKKNY
ncbi:MAG: FtsL-like putative cell division protein [Bacteroidales bacterium]|nr:FtsL-like putative cell division protein [Bacteroidales bacterium]